MQSKTLHSLDPSTGASIRQFVCALSAGMYVGSFRRANRDKDRSALRANAIHSCLLVLQQTWHTHESEVRNAMWVRDGVEGHWKGDVARGRGERSAGVGTAEAHIF